MFDETLRRLRQLEGETEVSIPLEIDDDGYFDRCCPSSECQGEFKVLMEDWRENVRDEVVYCPFCRHEDKGTEWNTQDQRRYIRDFGLAYIQGMLGEALGADARRFNQSQRRSRSDGLFDVRLSMSYQPGHKTVAVPPEAAQSLRQQFVCEMCDCRYASLGASFFCPACGHNSAPSTFDATVETVRALVPTLREVLSEGLDKDTVQDSVRQILEDQFGRLVGAFERLAEALFGKLPNEAQHPRRGNHFQRIDNGSALWNAAAGNGYDVFLSQPELDRLKLCFQRRHVLGHGQGIVDRQYLDRSGDSHYSVGQRLVIREEDVLELAGLISKLARGLRGLVP